MKKSKYFRYVQLIDDSPESLCYRFDCQCGDCEHAVYIDFEIDKEYEIVDMSFTKKIVWDGYLSTEGWWRRIKERIEIAFKVLIGKPIEFTEGFVMFADGVLALKEVIEEAEELMAERIKRWKELQCQYKEKETKQHSSTNVEDAE